MRNFIIVGTQRIGSSALAESVSFHPMIVCGWEWTLGVPWKSKLEVAEQAMSGNFAVLTKSDQEYMRQVYHPKKKWLGFRWLFRSSDKWIFHPSLAPAIFLDRLEAHIRWLGKKSDIHVIHLVRCDNLAWLKSKYLARNSKIYVGKTYPKDIKVNIPLHNAVARLRSKTWIDARLSTLVNTNPYMRIYYEDFLTKHDDVVSSSLRFLNLDPKNIYFNGERRIYPQSKGEIADYVLNYEELVAKLNHLNLLKSPLSSIPSPIKWPSFWD